MDRGRRLAVEPEVTPAALRRAMMDLLARREHSRVELRQKVVRRYPGCEEMIAAELARLEQEGLQCDERMAESFVRARIGRGQGPVKIGADLRARGLDDSVIHAAIAAAQADWEALTREVAFKRFGEDVPRERRERARWIRFLQQRGFRFDDMRWIR